MTSANWGLMDPNAFARGYSTTKGMIDDGFNAQRQGAKDNALRQYATNPNDPNALNALAQADPALAIQVRQQQGKQQAELTEASRANVLKGAQIIRQIQPKDQAGWDQALAAAQSMGIDTSSVPRQFDPTFAQNMVAIADTFEPNKAEQPTTMQRDYQFLQGRDPALAETYLKNKANPPRFMPDGAGGFVAVDPGAFTGGANIPQPLPGKGAGPPAVLTDDDWEEGGAASQGAGTFR